jgi:hypothetical protein
LVTKLGFHQLTHDPCVFVKRNDKLGKVLFTSVFVDDALIVGDSDMREDFINQLKKRFPVNVDGTRAADWLLGVKIDRDLNNGNITITQTQAIIKLAQACGLDRETSHYDCPLNPQLKLKKLTTPSGIDPATCINGLSYRSVVGAVLFISLCVRPDVSTAVGILARHSDTPGEEHAKELKRVVSYLYKTRDLGITYQRSDEPNRLLSFVDADYAGAHDYRSTSGHVIIMNGGPIVWSSKVQKVTAQSTTEAETIAAAECTKEVIYLRGFLKELGFSQESRQPSVIMEDNSAVTEFAKFLKNRASAKHYVVRLRFLQESVLNQRVKFIQTPTANQLADLFTKPLQRERFTDLRDQILGIKAIRQQPATAQHVEGLHELGGGVVAEKQQPSTKLAIAV